MINVLNKVDCGPHMYGIHFAMTGELLAAGEVETLLVQVCCHESQGRRQKLGHLHHINVQLPLNTHMGCTYHNPSPGRFETCHQK